MNNKTCGECKHYNAAMFHCEKHDVMAAAHNTCEDCTAKTITNGDKIRQGSDKELVIYKHEWSCHVCIYHDEKNKGCHCRRPNEKTCLDGMIDWLNAPVESEEKNGL